MYGNELGEAKLCRLQSFLSAGYWVPRLYETHLFAPARRIRRLGSLKSSLMMSSANPSTLAVSPSSSWTVRDVCPSRLGFLFLLDGSSSKISLALIGSDQLETRL